MSRTRMRAFVGALLGVVVAGSMMSVSPVAQANLKKPTVNDSGVVRSSGHYINGDKAGQYSRVDLSVKRRGKAVAWKSGSRLKPGKYKLVARGVSLTDKFPGTVSLRNLDPNITFGVVGDVLRSGWHRLTPTFTYSLKERPRVFNDPAEITIGEALDRTDAPVVRFWTGAQSDNCGDGYWQPHYSCFRYFNGSTRTLVEVPLGDPNIRSLSEAPGGVQLCSQLSEVACSGEVFIAPDGDRWAYSARFGTEVIPSEYVAKATVTYRNSVTGAEYAKTATATETRAASSGRWMTLDAFKAARNELDEFSWSGAATRKRAPKPVLWRDSVRFQVKPRPEPKPKPGGGNSGGGNWSYANCTEARNAGAAPVYRGDPGYGRHLDSDNDGVGCE